MLDRKEELKSTLIDWNSSYKVGISEIDQQHQTLVVTFNELNQAVIEEKRKNDLEIILDRLADLIQWNFNTEENLFAQYGYPWSVTHKAEHQTFVQKIVNLVREFKTGTLELTQNILIALGNWLRHHIIGKDKTYGYFFVSRGLN
jgi:hemerythrin-like metal-binding protein